MVRLIRNGSRGFTLLELMMVLVIITLLVSMGVFTYLSTIPRIRFRNDARGLSAVIQLARLRAISTGIPHGVAFKRETAATKRDRYFVFMDCAPAAQHPDWKFTDTDSNPDNNPPITTGGQCDTGLAYDPRIRDLPVQELAKDDRFGAIIGSIAAPSPGLEYITFNAVGQAVQGQNLAIGPGNRSEIVITHKFEGEDYETGVTLTPGTGLSYVFPMRKK